MSEPLLDHDTKPFAEVRIPLLNTQATEYGEYGERFSLRRATDAERERWAKDKYVRDVVPHRIPPIQDVLVYRRQHMQASADDTEFTEGLLVWLAAGSLYAHWEVEAAFCEEWFRSAADAADSGQPRHGGAVKHLLFSLPIAARPLRGPLLITRARDGIRKAITRFGRHDELSDRFRFPLARWYFSLNDQRRSIEDGILDLMIALEGLFVPEKYGDRAKAVRKRVARWYAMEQSGRDVRKLENALYEAYDTRSRIVHGDRVERERMDRTLSVLDQLTRQLLHDFIDSELEKFEPTALWAMPTPNTPSDSCGCDSGPDSPG